MYAEAIRALCGSVSEVEAIAHAEEGAKRALPQESAGRVVSMDRACAVAAGREPHTRDIFFFPK